MCVEFLWKSERYELIADVNKPIIAVFEKQRDFKVSFQNLGVSSNIRLELGQIFTIFKSRNSFFFLCQHHLHETLPFMVSEIVRSLLRHSPVIPESRRGGEFREATVWSVLSRGILWAGKSPRSSVSLGLRIHIFVHRDVLGRELHGSLCRLN